MQKRIYLLSTFLPVLGFLFATPALSAEADLAKAEKVYKRSCATCHGKQGEKTAMGESKIINQLKPEEISTALPTEEPAESIIEQDNVIEDLPVVEAEIESEIVEDVKDELRSDINTETQEKPSEGGFFSRLVKGLLKTKQNIGAGFRSFFLGKKIDDDLFDELEEQLLIADIGVPTTNKIIKNLTEHASRKQ